MKKILIFIFALFSAFSLVACTDNNADNNNNNTSEDGTSGDNNNDNNDNNGSTEVTTKAIVVYFSATGNTESVANIIANYISSEIYELEPVNPYTSADLNYGNSSSRVVQEHNDPNRHVELVTTDFAGFADATYIFLGAPVWWQELSWVIDDFVRLNDFTNKTIIPFGTSASSSFTTDNLEDLALEATWLAPQRFRSRASESDVTNWIDSLNLDL